MMLDSYYSCFLSLEFNLVRSESALVLTLILTYQNMNMNFSKVLKSEAQKHKKYFTWILLIIHQGAITAILHFRKQYFVGNAV